MKKMKMLIFMVLCFTASVAICQSTGAKIVVSLMSTVRADTLSLYDGEDEYNVLADKTGKYVFNLKPNKGLREVSIYVLPDKAGKIPRLPLVIGDNYNLNVITNITDSASFSGIGENEERLFCKNYWFIMKKWRAIDPKGHTPNDLYNDFDSMFRTPMRTLEENKSMVSLQFYKQHYDFLYYQQMGYKLDVPFWYVKETHEKLSKSIPDNYWNLIKQFELNGEVMKNSEYYVSTMTVSLPAYLENEYKYKSGKMDDTTFNNDEIFNYTFKRLEKLLTGNVRNYLLMDRLQSKLGQAKSPESVKPLIDEYVTKYSTPENIANVKELQDMYEKAVQLMPGKEPSPFIVKDKNGKNVTLKDFAGKVLYLDFWASWCGPCREQMKEGAPQLHEKFKDTKDLVFLYINLDKSISAGEKAIKDDKIEGVHLFGGDFKASNPIAQAFNISGIPRYVIIGKDGKILDVDAPRPSDERTPERLKEALKAN